MPRAQALAQSAQGREPCFTIGHDDLRGRGRRRRAHVGDEIGDGEIDLVADAADDGDGRGGDGARHRLVVEGPQILERAAAAGQNEHVALGPPAGQAYCRHDLRGGRCALHGHGIDQHRNRGEAPRQHVQDVADRGAAWAR